jgi:dolichol-phosphate mannosyltransferase
MGSTLDVQAKRIIAVLPAYNEEGKIGSVVSKIKDRAGSIVDRIVVVNDGSEDRTTAEAEMNGAVVITHRENQGAGAAIRSGIDYALHEGYDIIVIMGGDDQDDPAEIGRIVTPIIKEGYDFVQGSRYLAGGRQVNIPLFRWVTTRMYSIFFRIIAGFPVTDGTNGFRAFRTSLFKDRRIDLHQKWLDKYELEPYLFFKAIALHYAVVEVPVTKFYPQTKIGYTKMKPIIDWWRISKPLLLLWLRIKK